MADRYDNILEKFFTGGLDLEIKIREQELRHPQQEPDENIGGGRAQNKQSYSVENTMMKIESDRYLNYLKRLNLAIQVCVSLTAEEHREVFYQHYRNRLNWDVIAYEHNADRSTVIRWRDDLKEMCKRYNILEDE